MQKGKLKILIASALVVMMITPSLEVAAVEVHKNVTQGNATKEKATEEEVNHIPTIEDDNKQNQEAPVGSKEESKEESTEQNKEQSEEQDKQHSTEERKEAPQTEGLTENKQEKDKADKVGEKYEFRPKASSFAAGANSEENNFERPEFNLKASALKNIQYLQLKTDSQYEIGATCC